MVKIFYNGLCIEVVIYGYDIDNIKIKRCYLYEEVRKNDKN